MRVVIDTNILIGGANDESSHAFQIIKEVIDGRLEAYATHQTMSENRQMLRKLVKDREYRELLEEYFTKLQIVPPLHLPPPQADKGEKERGWVVADPEDNKLFESAVVANADYLITEDQEVLYVEECQGTKVVSPADFWAKYKSQEDNDAAWQDFAKMVTGK